MRKITLAAAAAIASATVANAQDAMLVLDASGSMWGEVEGRHKILIARDVIGDLLRDLPADRRLGLVAYGHNRRGDCADIETLASVGTDREAIRNAVNALSPLGMTPLSDAVRHAANELRYTERAATVILVSDGEETCNADPCALGAELEAAGVDFTAHVIGFDISTEEERRQLQCLAEETGGTFIVASNAAELSDALQATVAVAPPPEPVASPPEPVVTTGSLRLQATDLESGPIIDSGLVWRVAVAGAGGEEMYATDADDGVVTLEELPPRAYDVTVTRPSDGARAEGRIDLRPGRGSTLTLALEIELEASVRPEPADAAPVGSEILVHWTGPARDQDWISIAQAGSDDNEWIVYERPDASPLIIRMPSEPGEYEVRYVYGRPLRVLARASITATDVEASVTPPETALVGADIEIAWTGPDYEGDYIYISEPDSADSAQVAYTRADRGNPAELRAPGDPGTYEARYILSATPPRVLARATFEVTPSEASVTPPESVEAGSPIEIAWTGPDNDGDYIYISEVGSADSAQLSYVRADRGNPAELRAPAEPGTYEARYILSVGTRVLARATFEVTAAAASVSPPESVEAGSAFEIAWTGPNNSGDYIYISEPGSADSAQIAYVRTDRGNPAALNAPSQPGTYEARYILSEGTTVIARAAFEVTAAEASVSPPESVEAGSPLEVAFTGPDNPGDYIYVSEAGSADSAQVGYVRTDRGNPASLTAPGEPGEYEVRYILGVGTRAIARAPLIVTAPEASITIPATIEAGAELEVVWEGPNNAGDYIYLSEAGSNDSAQVVYARTDRGNPTELTAPGRPGEYEVRYILGQGTRAIARQPLTVTAATASFLEAPASAPADTAITISWQGPGNDGDYIAISEIGASDGANSSYARIRGDGPLELRTPREPGDYELRYVLRSQTVVIARQPITITAGE